MARNESPKSRPTILRLIGMLIAALLVIAILKAIWPLLLAVAIVVALVFTWRYRSAPEPRGSFSEAALAALERSWRTVEDRVRRRARRAGQPAPARPDPGWNRGRAQADAALQRGRVGEGLRWYAETGNLGDPQLAATLERVLPDRQIRSALLHAVAELSRLKASTKTARAIGVSPTVVSGIEQDAERVLAQLWPAASRLAAGSATANENGTTSAAFQERARVEVEKLDRLTAATRQAKDGLAIAMLPGNSGFDTESIAENLRLMGEVARDIDTS